MSTCRCRHKLAARGSTVPRRHGQEGRGDVSVGRVMPRVVAGNADGLLVFGKPVFNGLGRAAEGDAGGSIGGNRVDAGNVEAVVKREQGVDIVHLGVEHASLASGSNAAEIMGDSQCLNDYDTPASGVSIRAQHNGL